MALARSFAARVMALALMPAVFAAACGEGRPDEQASAPEETGPRPAVQELLAAHHLLGKQPEQRTDKEREADVDEETVSRFFADSRDFDPFIADLYRGFVLGALARHQSRLFIDTRGSKATVHAGGAAVVMSLEGGRWRVVLKESIPAAIAERAAREKVHFDEAAKKRPPPSR